LRISAAKPEKGRRCNIAEALAIGWPDRVRQIALLSIPPRLGGIPTPPFHQAQRYWYHWFMATPRGAEAVCADPHGFARIMWENWAPAGWFDEATFERTTRACDNPDWVDVTLHSYRARWDNAPPDPRSIELESRIKATTSLSLPAVYIQGDADGVSPSYAFEQVPEKFTGPFELIKLAGVGHFPQRDAPEQVAEILNRFFRQESASA